MKIYLTGSTGLLGKSIMREINSKHEVITYSSDQINLLEYQEVYESLKRSRPDMIIHCASLVGGIIFNVNNPYTMAWKNSIINMNILRASENLEIEKLISIGSSCCYPTDASKPFREIDYKPGNFEESNSNYALSKILMSEAIKGLAKEKGLKYKTIVMCNLFGKQSLEDSTKYHLINSIVEKIMIAKANKQRIITIGGSGKPRREFLDVSSAAKFIDNAISKYEELPMIINCGYFQDFSVEEYYSMVTKIAGYDCEFKYDPSIPDGVFSKKMNIDQALSLGWRPYNILDCIEELIDAQ